MSLADTRIQAMREQLGRMRDMQYSYHKKFFHGLYYFFIMVIGCLLWDRPISLALVPFLVITAGTQSCFYLHFVDFARLHARHLESRLNQALGKRTFRGSEIEELYFYPLEAPKIGGLAPTAPLRFFSFFTLHWVILWAGLVAYALWRLLPQMGPCGRSYLAIVGSWAFFNVGFLAFYFGFARDRHRVSERLNSVAPGANS